MVLQLSESLIRKGDRKEFQIPAGFDSLFWDGEPHRLEPRSPVILKVENVGNDTYRLQTQFEADYHLPCDRCLTDVACPLSIMDEREVKLHPAEETQETEEEEPFIHGYELDVDEFIRGELYQRIPLKVLCSEDCKGICPVCGTNRNLAPCTCEEGPRDPRMSVIQDIFRKANHG